MTALHGLGLLWIMVPMALGSSATLTVEGLSTFKPYFSHSPHALVDLAWEMASSDTGMLIDRLLKVLPKLDGQLQARIREIKELEPSDDQAKLLHDALELEIGVINPSDMFIPFILNYQTRRIFPTSLSNRFSTFGSVRNDLKCLADGILKRAEIQLQGPLLSHLYGSTWKLPTKINVAYDVVRLQPIPTAVKAIVRYRSATKMSQDRLVRSYKKDKEELGSNEAIQIYAIFRNPAIFHKEDPNNDLMICDFLLAAMSLSADLVSVPNVCATMPEMQHWLFTSRLGFPPIVNRMKEHNL